MNIYHHQEDQDTWFSRHDRFDGFDRGDDGRIDDCHEEMDQEVCSRCDGEGRVYVAGMSFDMYQRCHGCNGLGLVAVPLSPAALAKRDAWRKFSDGFVGPKQPVELDDIPF